MIQNQSSGFAVRPVIECGWNAFIRKGYSCDPADISVNERFIDHLAETDINWLIIFWTNGPEFQEEWRKLADYAHVRGLKVAKALYGFSAGGPDYRYHLGEPDVPRRLLRMNSAGQKLALCPLDEAAREWMREVLPTRITDPDMDGLMIEPSGAVRRHCICEKCKRLRPFENDVIATNFIVEEALEINPDLQIFMLAGGEEAKESMTKMAVAYQNLHPAIEHIFSFRTDTREFYHHWINLDKRFESCIKLGRIFLFPGGEKPTTSVEERIASLFEWAKLSAEKGKTGITFEYRIFGGIERHFAKKDIPSTRLSEKCPASIALMSAALTNPFLDNASQKELIERLRGTTDWDLDDPQKFYRG